MKYDFQLTLVVKTAADSEGTSFDAQSIDVVEGKNLTELMGKFLIVLAGVHHRLVNDVKIELGEKWNDDIPF